MRGVSSLHFLRLMESEGKIGFWTRDLGSPRGTSSVGTARVLNATAENASDCLDLFDIVHADDKNQYEEAVAAVCRGQAVDVEFRILRPDTPMRWVNLRAEMIFGREGKPTTIVGLIRDITREKSIFADLLNSRNRSLAVASLVGGIQWGMGAEGELLFKQCWLELTGQNPRDVQRWGWIDLVHPRQRTAIRNACLEAVETSSALDLEANVLIHGSTYKNFDIKAAPVVNGVGVEWIGLMIERSNAQSLYEGRELRPELLKPRTIAAARALVGWTHNDLAERAGISISSVRRSENEHQSSLRTKGSIIRAFHSAGVRFSLQGDTVSLGLIEMTDKAGR